MGTDYRDTGSELGSYEFTDDLEAEIGRPTKASQYNDMEDNANFLFFSCMHGRRGHTTEAANQNMYECEAGRIFGYLLFNNGQQEATRTIFDTKASGDDVTIPPDMTGRHLTIKLKVLICRRGEIPASEVEKCLPGNEWEYVFNQGNPGNWQADDYSRYENSEILYTGPGQGEPERVGGDSGYYALFKIQKPWLGSGNYVYLWVYLDSSNKNLKMKVDHDSDNWARLLVYFDIAYSPRTPYYGE